MFILLLQLFCLLLQLFSLLLILLHQRIDRLLQHGELFLHCFQEYLRNLYLTHAAHRLSCLYIHIRHEGGILLLDSFGIFEF